MTVAGDAATCDLSACNDRVQRFVRTSCVMLMSSGSACVTSCISDQCRTDLRHANPQIDNSMWSVNHEHGSVCNDLALIHGQGCY